MGVNWGWAYVPNLGVSVRPLVGCSHQLFGPVAYRSADGLFTQDVGCS
jgi:hypothetical protein